MCDSGDRSFDLGTVLSVTTGIMLAPNLMSDVRDIIGYMSGDEQASDIGCVVMRPLCKRALLAQYPTLPSGEDGFPDLYRYIQEQKRIHGASLRVRQLRHHDPVWLENQKTAIFRGKSGA